MPKTAPDENPSSKSELLEKAKKFLAISEKKEPNKKPLADLTGEIAGSLKTPGA